MRAAWRFVRPTTGTPTTGSGSLMRRLEAPSLPVWLPAPSPWLPAPPPRPPAPWTRARGLQAVPPPQVAPGGRRKRGGTDYAAPTGHSSWTTPEASEDCWWGRGGRLPSPGHAEARQSSVTTDGSAATITTTTVGSAAATTTRGRSPPGATTVAATAAAAKAAVTPLPGSLEGPGPQVSVAPFIFLISLSIMPTGLNPSFACQGFLPLCSQGRASSALGCCRRDSATRLPCSSWGSGSSGANVKRHRSGGGGPNCSDGYHSLNDDDAVEYTVGIGRGGPNYARLRHRGRRKGHIQLHLAAHSGRDGGGFWAVAPVRR
jgi:hypothetical protein